MLNDALKSLGLDDLASSDDELKKLRKTSFLYSDERALPVHSKASILAVYKVLEEVEDSKDKEDLTIVLDKKFTREFGKMSIEDAIASLIDNEDIKDEKDVDNKPSFDVDYDLLSDKVVEKIKSSFDLDDSFLAKRNESLEDEIESLEKENELLIDSLRSTIILQILQAEEKVSDTEYKAKLEGRTLDSLKDKLADLVAEPTEAEDVKDDNEESEEDSLEDSAKDDKDISDTDIDISDAVEDEGKVEDSDKDDKTNEDLEDNLDKLSVEQIRDEYKKLIRTEGMRAASGYLSDLREKNNLPANFTFSR